MRVAFICLLLINVLLFAWARWIDASARPVGANAAAVAPLQLASAQSPSRCWTAGPLPDAAMAATLAAALSKQGIGSRERTAERQLPDGYLVYAGNLQDAQARQQAISRLARAGIRDAAEMPAGQRADRISVGLFTERDGAQQRLARVRATGLEAAIEERFRPTSESWLDIDLRPDLTAPAISNLLPGAAVAELAWTSCPAGTGG